MGWQPVIGNQPENVLRADFAGCAGTELCYNN